MVNLTGGKSALFKEQNYEELKKPHVDQGTLFLDSTFPAIDGVIGPTTVPENVVWKRPKELTDAPRLFTDVESSRVVRAGDLSCNWMVSALAVLAGVNEIRNKVIPNYWDQEWTDKSKYCGIFRFRFWRFGSWVEVVVDDYLPTNGTSLMTTQAGGDNEFWAPLVEKAYAKLHGSYEALREGELSNALVDFTGGVSETIDLAAGRYSEMEDKRCHLFDLLHKESIQHSIICFTVAAPALTNIGERTELGMIKGHTYHMTEVKKVQLGETTLRSLFNGREKVALVRLRNAREEEKQPPGSPDSALSDGNPFAYSTDVLSRLKSKNSEWQQLKDAERQRLGLSFRDSTEFWMPLEDVVVEFSEVTICRLISENLFVSPGRKWRGSECRGAWEEGPKDSRMDRSGGGDISQDTFLRNPQYLTDIKNESEIIIQLLQFLEEDAKPTEFYMLMGIHVLKVENNRGTRLHKIWPFTPVVVAEDHRRKREVMYRGHLPNGRYLLIPSLYKQGETSKFFLRILSQQEQPHLHELKEDVPQSMIPCSCLTPEYQWVTVVVVEKADIENKSPSWGSSRITPFCTLICEGKKVMTEVAKDDAQPEWNSAFVFYRRKPDKPITLKVFNRNTLMPNELLGVCELPAAITHSPTPLDAAIHRKAKSSDENSTLVPGGVVHLQILTEDNLYAL